MFIVINTDGTLGRHEGSVTADAIRTAVGPEGFDIVTIHGANRDMCAFVNDEGFAAGLARNPIGACVAASLGARPYVYAGPIVITGWDRHADPEIEDLRTSQADLVEETHRHVQAALNGEDISFVGAPDWSDKMRRYAHFVESSPAPKLRFVPLA